jgi:hypothetical protein
MEGEVRAITQKEIDKFNEITKESGFTKVALFRQRMLEQDQIIELINEKFESQNREINNSIDWYVEEAFESKIVPKLTEILDILKRGVR